MNPATIIKTAASEGVNISLSPSGTIKATGDQVAVGRWLPVIREHKLGVVAFLREAANDPVRSSWGWRITHANGRTMEHYIVPVQTLAEMQAYYPGTVIVPIIEVAADGIRRMTAREEQAIRAWLELIGESDPATIADVMYQCQKDADAREYFTGRAAELNQKWGE